MNIFLWTNESSALEKDIMHQIMLGGTPLKIMKLNMMNMTPIHTQNPVILPES